MRRDLRFVEIGPLIDVRLDEELPPGGEEARRFVEKRRSDDEPPMVPLLPPRIRKMQIHARDLRGRFESRERQPRVVREHATARREPEAHQPIVHEGGPLAAHFESDDADVGLTLKAFEQKTAAPGADLDFEPPHRGGEKLFEKDLPVPWKMWRLFLVTTPLFLAEVR